MKAKDVVIGLVVLVILITGAIYVRNSRKAKTSNTPLPTPNIQNVENKFPAFNIPENADRLNLNKVSEIDGVGEAFKGFSNGQYSLTVVADLKSPEPGYFYQSWLIKGNSEAERLDLVSLGKMTLSKGGYISEFSSKKDYSGYKKVVVTKEKVFDNTPEVYILEGSY